MLLLLLLFSLVLSATLTPAADVPIGDSYIPQVANSGTQEAGFYTLFQFVNVTEGLATVRVEFFGPAGQPMNIPITQPDGSTANQTVFGIVLDRGGSAVRTTVPNGTTAAIGYAKVSMDPWGSVAVNATFVQIVPGRPLFMAGIPITNDHRLPAFMPYMSSPDGFTPSLALVGDLNESDEVTLIARTGTQGTELCRTTMALEDGHHRAFLLRDVLPCTRTTKGVVEVRASGSYGWLAGIGFLAHDSGAFVTQPIWVD